MSIKIMEYFTTGVNYGACALGAGAVILGGLIVLSLVFRLIGTIVPKNAEEGADNE